MRPVPDVSPLGQIQWQHDLAVLRLSIRAAQLVSNAPDEIGEFLVIVGDHCARSGFSLDTASCPVKNRFDNSFSRSEISVSIFWMRLECAKLRPKAPAGKVAITIGERFRVALIHAKHSLPMRTAFRLVHGIVDFRDIAFDDDPKIAA